MNQTNSAMRRMRGLLIGVMLLAIGACASTPNKVTNAAPGVDFNQYSTFGFFSPLATDEQGYESLVSNFLKVAAAQQMDSRGYSYSETPDLKINFYLHSKEKITSRTVPSMSGYYMYRDPFFYDPWLGHPTYETRIDQYTEGTLNIDVVDAKTKKLVWEGMVSGRVTDTAVRSLEKTVDGAVAEIMADFPRRSTGAAHSAP